jgi:RNA polymerase sigma factor (sigma-70 family)
MVLMNQRNKEIQTQLMKSYSSLMARAMNLCKEMPNRRDSATELLHETVAKTLDYFAKGKELPLGEMHFWMLTVMDNTAKNYKKSARVRLETQLRETDDDEAGNENRTTAKYRSDHTDQNIKKVNVIEAENKYFPRSLSMQLSPENKLNMNQCWEALGPEGQEIISLNLISKDALTTKQIAKKMRKPLGTLCVLLNRYKTQLHDCLSGAV